MKNLYRFHIRLIPLMLSIFAMGFAANAQSIEGDAAAGEKLFKTYCASCHKLDSKAIGPALGGVTDRRETDWLYSWIKNNASFRASGNADANAIFDEYNGSVMPQFENLSVEDIDNILAYTANPPAKPKQVVADGPVVAGGDADNSGMQMWAMIILGAIFLVLVFILATVRNTLRVVKGEEPITVVEDASNYAKFLRKNTGFMTVLTIVVAVAFLNVTYWYLMDVGVEGGKGMEASYMPPHPEPGQEAQYGEQPIAFSHKLHAGDNQIDCNYCHSSARHSKTSGIPSANVCMNCHMYVNGSEITDEAGNLKYGGEPSPEIDKIYQAVGWDANTMSYKEDHVEKPIRWVRIHNLPDLAYFNHAQHVTAGQVECQTCHGPVEEMEVMYQYSPLTMGWCINCHRETEVKVNTNGYYEPQHDKLVEKYHGEDITVEKIGGLECGKCHY
ncbi:MAG: c-type cytochrome [Flavobacteriia bacterium]|nr:c-type cytochrome [Flavobacteriia bacterium]